MPFPFQRLIPDLVQHYTKEPIKLNLGHVLGLDKDTQDPSGLDKDTQDPSGLNEERTQRSPCTTQVILERCMGFFAYVPRKPNKIELSGQVLGQKTDMTNYIPTNEEYKLIEVNKILITPLISSYLEENDIEFSNEVVPEDSMMVRTRLDTSKLKNIAEAISASIPLPPIQVRRLVDGTYSIENGMHRTAMSLSCLFTHIPVHVVNPPTEIPKWRPRRRQQD